MPSHSHRVVQERSEAPSTQPPGSSAGRARPGGAGLPVRWRDGADGAQEEQGSPTGQTRTTRDYEMDDQDVNKILIVTQTPPYIRKHPGGDRTGNHESRAKLTTDIAKAINDGLFYYEKDLWKGEEQLESSKVRKTWRIESLSCS